MLVTWSEVCGMGWRANMYVLIPYFFKTLYFHYRKTTNDIANRDAGYIYIRQINYQPNNGKCTLSTVINNYS